MTHLWDRANFQRTRHAPFGLCLVNAEDTDPIFEDAQRYQPAYFPEGMAVEFVDHQELPWLFRLPFKGEKKATSEPLDHPKQLNRLTKAIFHLPKELEIARRIQELSKDHIQFVLADEYQLILVFDDGLQGQEYTLRGLPLALRY